jgi:hypothetical protein
MLVGQLDLFAPHPASHRERLAGPDVGPALVPSALDDDSLVEAIPAARLSAARELAAEAARRRLGNAVPVLEMLARRFSGFGLERIVPEQEAALHALAAIGGREAAAAVARLIGERVIQGPALRQAVNTAACLQSRLPAEIVLDLLRNDLPEIRAGACACTGTSPQASPLLIELLADHHAEVRAAAALALGRIGRPEGRAHLLLLLRREPSEEIVEAIAAVADEECVVVLGRVARAHPALRAVILDALACIAVPRAQTVAAALRKSEER